MSCERIFVTLSNVTVLRHRVEQTACFLGFAVEAVVLACWCIRIMVRFREKALRFHGVNQSKCEQIALTGESRIPALESFFTHVPVRICGNEVSLADHVERSEDVGTVPNEMPATTCSYKSYCQSPICG